MRGRPIEPIKPEFELKHFKAFNPWKLVKRMVSGPKGRGEEFRQLTKLINSSFDDFLLEGKELVVPGAGLFCVVQASEVPIFKGIVKKEQDENGNESVKRKFVKVRGKHNDDPCRLIGNIRYFIKSPYSNFFRCKTSRTFKEQTLRNFIEDINNYPLPFITLEKFKTTQLNDIYRMKSKKFEDSETMEFDEDLQKFLRKDDMYLQRKKLRKQKAADLKEAEQTD